MEYLLVRFAKVESREVITGDGGQKKIIETLIIEKDRGLVVDGNNQGMTNKTIELEKGTHLIKLKSPPDDFKPNEIKVVLDNTSSLLPMEVYFEKVEL